MRATARRRPNHGHPNRRDRRFGPEPFTFNPFLVRAEAPVAPAAGIAY